MRSYKDILWLCIALGIAALGLGIVAITRPVGLFDRLAYIMPVRYDNSLPGKDDELHDGSFHIKTQDLLDLKAILKLPDGGYVKFQYGSIHDSGVDLQRFHPRGKTLWEYRCEELGVMHSEYYHNVFVYVEGKTLKVISRGSSGTFLERIDLESGKQLARVTAQH